MKLLTNREITLVKDNYYLHPDGNSIIISGEEDGEYQIVRLTRDKTFGTWSIGEILLNGIDNDIMRGISYLTEELNIYENLLEVTKLKPKKK